MDHNLNAVSSERTLCRRDSMSSSQRSYVLSLAECENLVMEGFDLETVAEEELFSRAIRICDYDSLGRLTQQIEQFASAPVMIKYSCER